MLLVLSEQQNCAFFLNNKTDISFVFISQCQILRLSSALVGIVLFSNTSATQLSSVKSLVLAGCCEECIHG